MIQLLRQESIALTRNILSYLGIMLLVITVCFTISATGLPLLSGLATTTIIIVTIITPQLALVYLATRYWATMHGDSGYFTHAIPVRASTIFWAKTLYAIVATFASLIVTILGVCAFFISRGWAAGATTQSIWSGMVETFEALPTSLLLAGAFLAMITIINIAISVAGTISFCAQDKYIRHGFAVPTIGLVLYYFAYQISGLLGALLIPGSINVSNGSFTWQLMLTDFINAIQHDQQPQVVGIGIVLTSTVLTAVIAWLGIRSLRNHLSLR